MELTGWYVIVPLCLASLVTGLVMSLGTRWGLFRHYWVLAKLLITIVAMLILFAYMKVRPVLFRPSLSDLEVGQARQVV